MADVRALAALAALALAACAAPAPTPPEPATASAAPAAPVVVGGAAFDSAASILDNLANSADHKTLVGALRSAGLASRPGPVTLFAPTDDAFARLPHGTMDALTAPESGRLLAQVLNYHLVSGSKTAAQIAADVRAGGGGASYRTLQGGSITVSLDGGRMTVTDVHGNRVAVTVADARASNGVVHVVDQVLLPAT
jgi:uncharacterized surface protein with fasciclin (FAS1) repeats